MRRGWFLLEAHPQDACEVCAGGFEAARIERARDIHPPHDLATTRGRARECGRDRHLARTDGAGDLADAAARDASEERIEGRDTAGEAAVFAGQFMAFEDSRKFK